MSVRKTIKKVLVKEIKCKNYYNYDTTRKPKR